MGKIGKGADRGVVGRSRSGVVIRNILLLLSLLRSLVDIKVEIIEQGVGYVILELRGKA